MTNIATQIAALDAEWTAALAIAKTLKAGDALRNEGADGYSAYAVESERLANIYAPQIQALKARQFAAEWTPEVTAARRAAWNAAVIKCKSHGDVAKLADRLGYGIADIARAKQINGIA